jgi:hypothetical protein
VTARDGLSEGRYFRPAQGVLGWPCGMAPLVTSVSRATLEAVWGLADQSLSSVLNLALGVVIARGAAADEFGAFALAITSYWAVLSVTRASLLQPLLIRYSSVTHGVWRRATGAAVGAVLAAAFLVAPAFAVIGVLVGGKSGEMFLAVGIALPSVLVRDAYRAAFFAARRGRSAFLNQASWWIVILACFALTGMPQGPDAIWIWCGTAALAAAAAVAQAQVMPRISKAHSWWRSQRDVAPLYAAESIVTTAAWQLALFGVGAVAGIVAVGTIRAAELLFGPVQMLIQTVWVAAIPQARDLLKASPRRLWIGAVTLGSVSTALVLVWGGIAHWLPTSIGVALLGASWASAHDVILPATVMYAALFAAMAASTGLVALAAARRSLIAGAGGAAILVAGALIGSAFGTASAFWGLALANFARTGLYWSEFRHAVAHGSASSAQRQSNESAVDIFSLPEPTR